MPLRLQIQAFVLGRAMTVRAYPVDPDAVHVAVYAQGLPPDTPLTVTQITAWTMDSMWVPGSVQPPA
jgi:hypothetical protein